MDSTLSTWIESTGAWRYFIYSDHSLYLEWPKSKDISIAEEIISVITKVASNFPDHILDYSVGYHSGMIYFDHSSISHDDLIKYMDAIQIDTVSADSQEVITVPMSFAQEHALDLSDLALHCELSIDQVKALFLEATYTVHFMGFMPGFMYMGGLPDQLLIPRRGTPRIKVPAGSVAIANGQTGIYPIDSPGGWHIIGKTDMKFFSPEQAPPSPISTGTQIKFTEAI